MIMIKKYYLFQTSCILFCLLFSLNAFSYDFEEKNADSITIYYNITSNKDCTCEITYKGKTSNDYNGDIRIPNSVKHNGIEYSVTKIGTYAFSNCRLNSIDLPNTITKIGSYAFYNCINLKSIVIPSNVTEIGSGAFSNCTNLISADLSCYESIIKYRLFYDCSNLTDVILPYSVKEIESAAFNACYKLSSISLPSIEKINSMAFYECRSLTTMELPKTLSLIGSLAFGGCNALSDINIDEDNNYYSSHNGVLFDKEMKTLISYPVGRKESSYTIPNGVVNIDDYAFYGCSLSTVKIPETLEKIGDCAFCFCSHLDAISLPNSIKEIGKKAFYHCLKLTSMKIPTSVNHLSDQAFELCKSLNKVELPNSITSVGKGVFCDCQSLIEVSIPESLSIIGEQMFANCSKIRFIEIPKSVTNIGEHAFNGCSNMSSIIIGENVSNIEMYAFKNCPALKEIISLNETPPTIHYFAVEELVFKEDVYLRVPESAFDSYKSAEIWQYFVHIDKYDPTDINEIYFTKNYNVSNLYDTNGRMVHYKDNGLFIKNGKKFLIRY